jgi:dihydropyrimidinase
MPVLIKNGRIITATDDYVADIFIEGETVSAIGKNLSAFVETRCIASQTQNIASETQSIASLQEIDASGMLVFPGGVDPHVHLEMPFMGTFSSDTHATGTRAALFGGTTTVIDGLAGPEEPLLVIIAFTWLSQILMKILRRKLRR